MADPCPSYKFARDNSLSAGFTDAASEEDRT